MRMNLKLSVNAYTGLFAFLAMRAICALPTCECKHELTPFHYSTNIQS